MALDAMWVVSRLSGLKLAIKPGDFQTRKGSKTAWMGTYWDDNGVEREVTGARVVLPDGREVPQVREYKYLGTPLQVEYKGRQPRGARRDRDDLEVEGCVSVQGARPRCDD